jgi:hypothetical protein
MVHDQVVNGRDVRWKLIGNTAAGVVMEGGRDEGNDLTPSERT